MQRFIRILGAASLAGLLAACGGNGAGGAIPNSTDAQPPDSYGDPSLQQSVPSDPSQTTDPSQTPDPSDSSAPTDPQDVASTEAARTRTAGVPEHVLTGDYFGTPWGTTRVDPNRARRYLDWVRTGVTNGDRLADAGFKVQVYSNPNRVETRDPLYRSTSSSGFAATCHGSRVYDSFKGIRQYVTDPGTEALRRSYGELVRKTMERSHIDAMFEDNTGPLEDFGVRFEASMPCRYSAQKWIEGEKHLESSLPVGTIINGLSAFHDHSVSQSLAMLDNPKTLGGEVEHCFSDNSRAEQGAWPWVATEDTQLRVVERRKIFQCQAVNTREASTQEAARIYTLASFLMTYDPSYSVLWELFSTPSRLHVMPESQFVALDPVTRPSSVEQLRQSGGAYVREYRSCYYASHAVGRCAVAVNPDYASRRVELAGFHHTLALRGNGILDGGRVSLRGAAPRSVLARTSAEIALP